MMRRTPLLRSGPARVCWPVSFVHPAASGAGVSAGLEASRVMDDLDGRRDAPGHLSDGVLPAYLDAAPDLTPAARASVEAHLAGCAACRAALRDLGATVALLRDLPQLAPRRSFALTPELVEGAPGRARQPARPAREPVGAGGRRFAWV